MVSSGKITILLADEDALRRDGLSAVLSANENFEVVSAVPDGEAAMRQMRDIRPDVAIIELNLPKIHGIELVRRVRSESLPTKLVIMASTNDDDIVREVVRAGADGYLLKNGPSRHLIDAILYVRDGGQYFSPQLQRDGRDRHLLEEPRRAVQPAAADEPKSEVRSEFQSPEGESRPRRRHDPAALRQRLRDEVVSPGLNERDYEIMSMMADGIRPILDRLEEIDSRVSLMESGDEQLPAAPRAWLSTELTRTYSGGRRGSESAVVSRTVADMEARLPQLIEQAVTERFNQMAGRLQKDIEETHVRTLESFVKNIQVKLVRRVTALEGDMTRQAEAMHQLRDYSQRTEENLSRLISGVDKLANDLPGRLTASGRAESHPGTAMPGEILPAPAFGKPARRSPLANAIKAPAIKLAILSAGALLVLGMVGWGVYRSFAEDSSPVTVVDSVAPNQKKVVLPGMADTTSRLKAAVEAVDRKDFSVAEDAFRSVLQAEPQNADAIKGLASVLFRQDKTDEAAAILDKMPKD
ncbi:MAG: two component transcriptional regulator, LuxR family [Bryobacterales bacterium]|jgi:DNA-binding NarL/FixJ family response regulator/TolA-binding protein|nr:two component transcriptional regulator, LuxR family [Bryobacterales bacterium]